MAQKRPANRADRATLRQDTARDLRLLRELWLVRDRMLTELVGRKVRRSIVFDEIIRLCVLEFHEDRYMRVTDYVQHCKPYGSAPSVRTEINMMVDQGLIGLESEVRKGRTPPSSVVYPTQKLVDFYNHAMPLLRHALVTLIVEKGLIDLPVDPLIGLMAPP